jgi:5-aminopentanamidase
MKLALAQLSPVAADVEANVQTSERMIRLSAERGAALVAFPELWLTGYELDHIAHTEALWFHDGDPRLAGVVRACASTGTAAILGAPWRDREGRPRLAAVVISGDGSVQISCKQYLHGREHDLFTAGRPAPPFQVQGWRVAVAVCFDAAKPDHAAAAATQAADLYLGSALYTVGEERRSDLHFGARAMDHRMFAALVNYAGTTGGMASCGLSGVWRPNGEVLCRAADDEQLMIADLDRAELEIHRVHTRVS